MLATRAPAATNSQRHAQDDGIARNQADCLRVITVSRADRGPAAWRVVGSVWVTMVRGRQIFTVFVSMIVSGRASRRLTVSVGVRRAWFVAAMAATTALVLGACTSQHNAAPGGQSPAAHTQP